MTTPSSSSVRTKRRVVVVGGGFGGVRVARQLSRHPELNVTLISQNENFAYYPQLYHAATGGSRAEASIPLSDLLHGTNVQIQLDTVTKVDPEGKNVTGVSGRQYSYDQLILALGSVTNYFGIAGLKEFSYDIKTIEGAEEFKQHLHKQLVEDKQPELHYVIVGGGPTGVELAAALGQYLERIVRLHGVEKPQYKIDLVEAAPRLVPRLPEAVAKRIKRHLQDMDINVMTGATVEAETADSLRLKGELITTKTVVWTAGVANNPFFAANAAAFTLARNGRVEVDEYMQARPDVYVIGDNASTKYGGLALSAVKDANFVARDIMRVLHGRRRPKYRPLPPPSVLPVGENWAAALIGPLRLYGRIGWWLRRAADLLAYADVESWPQALSSWRQDDRREDNCPVCSAPSQVGSLAR